MRFCYEEFLNLDEIWYTDQPKFSRCFRDTLLVWLPACSFIVLISGEIYGIHRAKLKGRRQIPYNNFNISRLLFVFALFCMKISELISYVYELASQPDLETANSTRTQPSLQHEASISALHTLALSTLLVPIIQSLSYLILGITYCKQRKAGLHTSGPIWFYLFIAVICSSIDYYAVISTPLANNLISDVDYLHFPTLVILFILECRGDTPQLGLDSKQDADDDVRPTNPLLCSSFCSRITFWWFNKFLMFGYQNRLRLCDLWKTLPRDKSSELIPVFCKTWLESTESKGQATYLRADGKVQQSNDTLRVLIRLFAPELLVAALLRIISDLLQYVTPSILKAILVHLKSDSYQWHGLLLALLLLMVPALQSIILSYHIYRMELIGLHTRAVLMGAVYRKSLLLSGSSRLQSTSGEIVNLMSVDANRFQDLLLSVNMLWSVPLQMTLAIFLLHRELGWPIFAGVIFMVMLLPFNSYIANKIKSNQVGLMRVKDEKIKLLNEVFSGIRVIKLYAWENSFMKSCLNFRNVELSFLGRILTFDAVQVFLWNCSPFLVACVTLCVYVSIDEANVLDAEKAFVSISLFNLLRFPLAHFPQLVTSFMLTMVSVRRLNKFLNSDELVEYVTREDDSNAITIDGATMAWASLDVGPKEDCKTNKMNEMSSLEPQVILRDINLQVKPGSFVAIVGQVASGKTSLISSILGEMQRISGKFNIKRSLNLAYVPQRAFIQNLSVRDNILFGSSYNEQRYTRTLASCCLLDDLDILPGGDQAEIGEKGINLSGGQKQRVSLARACYSDSDIILLDDPLSALDSHVAKHVFDEVLSSTTGLLKDKTRVLATNSLFVLPYVDQVVVLESGRVAECGSYQELMRNESGNLAEIMRQYNVNQENTNEATEGPDTNETVVTPSVAKSSDKVNGAQAVLESAIKTDPSKDQLGKLIGAEKMEEGSVGLHVYVEYFIRSYTPFRLSIVIIGLSIAAGFNVATNVWLSLWASDAEDAAKSKDTGLRTLRMLVYALFGALQCFILLLSSLALYRAALRGAERLHTALLEGVMHSPMTFFDTTPIGRIVNRFAKDIEVIDSPLPCKFRSWINTSMNILSTLSLICYTFPGLLVLIIPLACIYIIVQRVFIVTTRQLKRLESVTRSPIYSNFNETLSGISTIRAYNCVGRFVESSDSVVDRNQSCSYPNIIATRWLSIRLEFFANLISSSVAFFAVLNGVSPGAAGLTISFSLLITISLSWLVLMSSDLETNIVSVERVLEYMENEPEDEWIKEESRPPAGWPASGAINFRHYSTRYRKDTELVLRDVSVGIKACEKIGVVGRTGSGKSSFSLSLFRILEGAAGSIDIDSLDIARFGLHDIRSRLTIIPQDPVLFSGTLRFNLDPLKLNSDSDIWRALELAHLRPHINKLGSGLEYQVSEYGENFSVGQRQLICLARAILRKTKILVLDEATASVDQETDALVQRTIREVFRDCTIITIAHRLHTILDSDRIIVLDAGRILELGAPAELIENDDSTFLSLVRDAGIDVSQLRASSTPTSMTKL